MKFNPSTGTQRPVIWLPSTPTLRQSVDAFLGRLATTHARDDLELLLRVFQERCKSGYYTPTDEDHAALEMLHEMRQQCPGRWELPTG